MWAPFCTHAWARCTSPHTKGASPQNLQPRSLQEPLRDVCRWMSSPNCCLACPHDLVFVAWYRGRPFHTHTYHTPHSQAGSLLAPAWQGREGGRKEPVKMVSKSACPASAPGGEKTLPLRSPGKPFNTVPTSGISRSAFYLRKASHQCAGKLAWWLPARPLSSNYWADVSLNKETLSFAPFSTVPSWCCVCGVVCRTSTPNALMAGHRTRHVY